jgi:hypothetical protein
MLNKCRYCGEVLRSALRKYCGERCRASMSRLAAKAPNKPAKAIKRPPVLHMRHKDREALVSASNGTCDVCGGLPLPGRKLNIDHCHTTGAIRGLLCHGCNVGLGYFKDSPERLIKAAEYLQKRR